jgi:hypothetical protein
MHITNNKADQGGAIRAVLRRWKGKMVVAGQTVNEEVRMPSREGSNSIEW